MENPFYFFVQFAFSYSIITYSEGDENDLENDRDVVPEVDLDVVKDGLEDEAELDLDVVKIEDLVVDAGDVFPDDPEQ